MLQLGVTYSGNRLSSKFTKIRDKTVKDHQHNITYYVKCLESQFSGDYTGETSWSLSESVLDHNGRDAKSQLVKHAIEKCHKYPKAEDFNIISKGYGNNTFKRKVAESLLIKDARPILNIHGKSVPLKLFKCYDIWYDDFHYFVRKTWKHVCGRILLIVIFLFTISL